MNKILVVDDDQESRDLLREVLEANGYTVDAAADGVAARNAIGPDGDSRIIIADMRMPNETGLDLLRKLRQDHAKHEMILMSSFFSVAEKKAAKELGVHALLVKPFRLSELLQAVAELAARNPLRIQI